MAITNEQKHKEELANLERYVENAQNDLLTAFRKRIAAEYAYNVAKSEEEALTAVWNKAMMDLDYRRKHPIYYGEETLNMESRDQFNMPQSMEEDAK